MGTSLELRKHFSVVGSLCDSHSTTRRVRHRNSNSVNGASRRTEPRRPRDGGSLPPDFSLGRHPMRGVRWFRTGRRVTSVVASSGFDAYSLRPNLSSNLKPQGRVVSQRTTRAADGALTCPSSSSSSSSFSSSSSSLACPLLFPRHRHRHRLLLLLLLLLR